MGDKEATGNGGGKGPPPEGKGGPPPGGKDAGAKGGPPPLPSDAPPPNPGKLPAADKGAAKQDTGAKAGGTAAPCDWKLKVDVTSLHPFWPKKEIKVGLFPPGPADKRADPAQTESLKMEAKTSPKAVFCGSGKVTYDVSAATSEKGWKLAKDLNTPLPNDAERINLNTGDDKYVGLKIHNPLWVYLQLLFKEPDSENKLPFPQDFPVKVVFPANKFQEEQTLAEGKMKFEVSRDHKSFSLEFSSASAGALRYIAHKTGEAKTTLKAKGDIPTLQKEGQRFFSLPEKWSLVQSMWDVTGAPSYKTDTARFDCYTNGDPVLYIGEEKAPVLLVLDPHWQFLRFEYFDRYYGHSDHGDWRVNIPPLVIEGARTTGKMPDVPHTSSQWTIRDDDIKTSVHCLPWIIQKSKGKPEPKPDKQIQLRFKTEAKTFMVSYDKAVRKLEVVGDTAKLKPSADRFKYYDLPGLWRSKNYYVRFKGGGGGFFEDIAKNKEERIKESLAADNPLIFSLDDVVLTDENQLQIALGKKDPVAVFHHRFSFDVGALALHDLGIYDPDSDNKKSYASALELKGKNYIFRYPDWVRLVIDGAQMFDVFDKRTKQHSKNAATGARAGVRWVDLVKGGLPAGASKANRRGTRKDFDFFTAQPFYTQDLADRFKQYTGGATPVEPGGRFDLALLRCCDHKTDDAGVDREVATVIHYLRMMYDFKKGTTVDRPQWQDDISLNVANRWNGGDAVNASRVLLTPKNAADKLCGQVILYTNPVTKGARAHFKLDVVKASERQGVSDWDGTGELDQKDSAPDNAFAAGSFTAAHEFGHCGSLPDDYCERWSACSGNELSYQNNLPGDPYQRDNLAMMSGALSVRGRYLWHAAEFARAVTGVPFVLEHDVYKDYKVPPHPQFPYRSYLYWPINEKINFVQGGRGKMDLLLYSMGKDDYTVNVLPGGPHQGMLVVMVRLNVTLDAAVKAVLKHNQILPRLSQIVQFAFNDVWWAKGTVKETTPQEWKFDKCLIEFSPRFLVNAEWTSKEVAKKTVWYWKDNTKEATYKDFLKNIPPHFNVAVKLGAPTKSQWTAAGLELQIDNKDPNWDATIQTDFMDKFAEMVGFANWAAVDKKGLKPLAGQVITKNADADAI
ncbi:MAG: hypothetical protein AAB225_07265 [Acidobacteriota bacterium]